MVLSIIDKNINYPELKRVEKDDINEEGELYEIELLEVLVLITIGKIKKMIQNDKIFYYPVYFIKKNNKAIQIGVYEILENNKSQYIDEKGELMLDKLDLPLLYSFVNKEFLIKLRKNPEIESEIDEREQQKSEEGKKDGVGEVKDKNLESQMQIKNKDSFVSLDVSPPIPENITDVFSVIPNVGNIKKITTETFNEAKKIRSEYKTTEAGNEYWINTFMRNKYYSIIDNEGGGDCFFAVIRDAYQQIGWDTSVLKIRRKLSSNVNDEIFETYKNYYMIFYNELQELRNLSLKNKKEYDALKKSFTESIDRNDKLRIYNRIQSIIKDNERLKYELNSTKEYLRGYDFMKNIKDIDDFKRYIQRCEFWADEWALSTLERALNTKIIILSSERYNGGDLNNVLSCGSTIDPIIQRTGVFSPLFYIISEHTGEHYKLIGYKDKLIFTFNELPYDLKRMIVDKCLERNAGLFALIDNFKKFKENKPASDLVNVLNDELSDSKILNLYDDNIVFSFYIKSANKPLPGKGSGEKINIESIRLFSGLTKISDWRRKLSNSWIQIFTLDNHRWSSVQHYYQASKFKKNNPEYYLSFSLDSGTELSKDADMARSAGNKTGKYKGVLIKPKNVLIDSDFYNERNKEELKNAIYAKFSQNIDLKELLLLTRNAKLVEYQKGKEAKVADELMLVRNELQS